MTLHPVSTLKVKTRDLRTPRGLRGVHDDVFFDSSHRLRILAGPSSEDHPRMVDRRVGPWDPKDLLLKGSRGEQRLTGTTPDQRPLCLRRGDR